MSARFTKPAELAADIGISERSLRTLARKLGACHVFGKTMVLTDENVAAIRPHVKRRGNGTPTPSDRRQVVYFLRCGDFIKIGYSHHFPHRLAAIRATTPFDVEVVVVMPGTATMERAFHKQFAAHHHRLEWFRHEGALADYLAGQPPVDSGHG